MFVEDYPAEVIVFLSKNVPTESNYSLFSFGGIAMFPGNESGV